MTGFQPVTNSLTIDAESYLGILDGKYYRRCPITPAFRKQKEN